MPTSSGIEEYDMTHGVPSLRRLAAEAVVTHDLNPAPLPQDLIIEYRYSE